MTNDEQLRQMTELCRRLSAALEGKRINPNSVEHGPAMLDALKQVSFYSRINHVSPKDYGDLVNGVLKKMGVKTGEM